MNGTKTLIELISSLQIGPPAVAGNLALLPLLASCSVETSAHNRYLVYQQALDMGLISIKEVSEAGVVGTLRVANRSNGPVLLVEGEVLLGMKQTRVLNLTILVPAKTVMEVPVSCVESGRWRAMSDESTGTSPVNLAPSIRAAKTVTVAQSMRNARSFASDQDAVWAGVDRVLDRHGANAPSRSYADLATESGMHLTNIASSIEPATGQVGVIACINGRESCADVLETPDVLASLWSGLVASYQAEGLMSESMLSKPLGCSG
jgi:hypothetical protein